MESGACDGEEGLGTAYCGVLEDRETLSIGGSVISPFYEFVIISYRLVPGWHCRDTYFIQVVYNVTVFTFPLRKRRSILSC